MIAGAIERHVRNSLHQRKINAFTHIAFSPDVMAARPRYRFYVNRTEPAYRLALRDRPAFPEGTDESEWQLTRERDEDDVNADVRGEIAARGYCLFAIGRTLDVIKRRTD
jgi:hypothetical protein